MDSFIKVTYLIDFILTIVMDAGYKVEGICEGQIQQAKQLKGKFKEFVLVEEEDLSEFDIPDPELQQEPENAFEVQNLFQELGVQEPLSMLGDCEEVEYQMIFPMQLSILHEATDFIESLSGFTAIEELIGSGINEISKYEQLYDDEEMALNSWKSLMLLNFEARECYLRGLLLFLDFYIKCGVDLISSKFAKKLTRLHSQFDLPRACYCCFLGMFKALSTQCDEVCEVLAKRLGKNSENEMEFAGNFKNLSIEDLSLMLPLGFIEYKRAAKKVCSCRL